ncbi:MAG: purine-nucleoside phosphorylase [Coriobacteriales bacterium]|jgi:purine-nucleoside phosphorylase|nr:purine-nucleoside phosphorylase [Coriobacteriales bacterium]
MPQKSDSEYLGSTGQVEHVERGGQAEQSGLTAQAEQVAQAVHAIRPRLDGEPRVAIILGSGLGGLAERINVHASISYDEIPHVKRSGAPGHAGRFIFGELGGQQVICMQGRLHGYEGNTAQEIVFPLRVMHALGARTLIVTNAAGGVNTAFGVGDIMLIRDHINLTGAHPLTLSSEQGACGFVDMSHAYTPELCEQALTAAENCGLALRQGVYLGVRGPSFETPAEIRAFRVWGADAVGMSTVFEVITAASLGMEVLGLSLITNMAAGILDAPITGEEVLEVSKVAAQDMERLVVEVLANFSAEKYSAGCLASQRFGQA